MKRRVIEILCATLVLSSVAACGTKENTEDVAEAGTETVIATESGETTTSEKKITYNSKLVTLGEYKGLSYTDTSDREPTDEEVEAEMQGILSMFDGGELTDEWVQENLEMDSVEAFREDTRKNLKEVYEQQAWKQAARELYAKVLESSEFDMDETDVNTERNDYLLAYQEAAASCNVSYEQYVTDNTGMTLEEFETKAGESAEQVIKVALVAKAIVEQENIDVDAHYDEVVGQIVEEQGYDTASDFEDDMEGKDAVLEEVRYRLAAQAMMDAGTPVQE